MKIVIKRYILEVVVKYSKDLRTGLSFLPERIKTNKCSKLVCNLHDKKKLCYSHKILKTSIRSWSNIKASGQNNSV